MNSLRPFCRQLQHYNTVKHVLAIFLGVKTTTVHTFKLSFRIKLRSRKRISLVTQGFRDLFTSHVPRIKLAAITTAYFPLPDGR